MTANSTSPSTLSQREIVALLEDWSPYITAELDRLADNPAALEQLPDDPLPMQPVLVFTVGGVDDNRYYQLGMADYEPEPLDLAVSLVLDDQPRLFGVMHLGRAGNDASRLDSFLLIGTPDPQGVRTLARLIAQVDLAERSLTWTHLDEDEMDTEGEDGWEVSLDG